jgi:hypothetical protein
MATVVMIKGFCASILLCILDMLGSYIYILNAGIFLKNNNDDYHDNIKKKIVKLNSGS